ncbi:MAG: hypothetical protein MUE41_15300 [Gemmatimonadaceae bacterium]|nr:hypothetical protein [Gemmatimonadaceae bacterium]
MGRGATRRLRTLGALALVSVAPLEALRAQDSATVARPFAASRLIEPTGGVHYGVPLRWSLSLGVIVDYSRRGDGGAIVLAESGLGGVRGSIGWVRFMRRYGSGVSLRASVMRTNREPWRFPARETFVGLEAQLLPLFATGVRAGVWREIGSGADRQTRVTIGASLGL